MYIYHFFLPFPLPKAVKQGKKWERRGLMMAQQKKKGSGGTVAFNVVGAILCLIFIPIILINLVLIVKTYTDADHIPSVAGYSPVICLSGSMEPTFSTGDMILIRRVDDPAALRQGDVICYLTGEGVAVTHTIVQVTELDGQVRYVTQGDANNAADQLAVSPDQVEGVYTGVHIPKLGSLAMFMQTTTGMIVFIVCPLLLLVGWDVLRRRAEARREKARAQALEERLKELESAEDQRDESLDPRL